MAGPLPKPTIWAEPDTMIGLYKSVTIWCEGSWETQEYHLHKEGNINPWDRQYPLESNNKAKFCIQQMSIEFAGIYKCYYKSLAGFSEYSDTLELVVTGVYEKPSLSVWPHHNVTSGESIIMQCSSLEGFGRFILIQEGKRNLSWTLDSQQHANQPFHALFVLGSVTLNHNGTFRCYGYYRNKPQVWSDSSDPLDLLVSAESKDQTPNSTKNGLGRYQKILIAISATFLLILFLLLLLILFWYQCKGKNKKRAQRETNLKILASTPEPTPRDRLQKKSSSLDVTIEEECMYASVKDTPQEDSEEFDNWNPPSEDSKRIVYAQVKPFRLQKDDTSREHQDVTYAQLCRKTQE